MKNLAILLCSILVLLPVACTWDFHGPCHRATVLRKEATNTYGPKRAEVLKEMMAAQNECDTKNQEEREKQHKRHQAALCFSKM